MNLLLYITANNIKYYIHEKLLSKRQKQMVQLTSCNNKINRPDCKCVMEIYNEIYKIILSKINPSYCFIGK